MAVFAVDTAARAETLVIGRAVPDSVLIDAASRVMTEAARRIDLSLRFQRIPLARSILMVDAGELDGDLLRTRHMIAGYQSLIPLTTSVVRFDVALYGASASVASLTREDLRQLRVGAARGLDLARLAPDLSITEVPSDGTIPDMLRSGRFEAALASYVYAETWRLRHGGIFRWPHCLTSEPLYVVLHRKHADLARRLDAALAQMQSQGLIERYYREALAQADIVPLDCPITAPQPSASPTGGAASPR